MSKHVLLIGWVMLLLFSFTNSFGNNVFNIAIIDLEGVGADVNQCSIASDKIRNILLQSSTYGENGNWIFSIQNNV